MLFIKTPTSLAELMERARARELLIKTRKNIRRRRRDKISISVSIFITLKSFLFCFDKEELVDEDADDRRAINYGESLGNLISRNAIGS
jgi:hypothetical protein